MRRRHNRHAQSSGAVENVLRGSIIFSYILNALNPASGVLIALLMGLVCDVEELVRDAVIASIRFRKSKNRYIGRYADVLYRWLRLSAIIAGIVLSVIFVQKVPLIMPALFIAALGLNAIYNIIRIFKGNNKAKYTKNLFFDVLFLLLIGSLVLLHLTEPFMIAMIVLVGAVTGVAVLLSVRKGVKEEILAEQDCSEDEQLFLKNKYSNSQCDLDEVCNNKIEKLEVQLNSMRNSSFKILYRLEIEKIENKISAIKAAKQYLNADQAFLPWLQDFDTWIEALPRSTFQSFYHKRGETEQLLEAVGNQI